MAIENLKQNIDTEKEILKEIVIFTAQLESISKMYPYEKRDSERKMIIKALNSLTAQLKIINNSIPGLLNSISPYKSLTNSEEITQNLVKIQISGQKTATIESADRERFFQELSVSKDTIDRLKYEKNIKVSEQEFFAFKKSNLYVKISNKIFQNFSNNLINKGNFDALGFNLRKANLKFLLVSYISMMFFTTLLSIFVGIGLFFFFNSLFPESMMQLLAIIPGVPLLVYFSLYFYPAAEKKSLESNINQEIPFVTIHMSAIAGSGIEPSQIFKIIAKGDEYKYTKTEINKILNQLNVYGYDLVTALKNTARETSSKKLAELLNGMAATISGGSELTTFLDKRSETLLFDYKLEKEKYTKEAETFMDIYISLMIAAPMIMTLLLVLITVSRIDIGLSLRALTTIIISIVSLINFVFLIFLQLDQPGY